MREQLFAGHLFADNYSDNYSQDLFSQAMLSTASIIVVRQTVMRTDTSQLSVSTVRGSSLLEQINTVHSVVNNEVLPSLFALFYQDILVCSPK